MRNLLLAIATASAAFTLLHCAGNGSGGGGFHAADDDAGAITEKHDAGIDARPPNNGPADAGPKTVADAGHDAGPPPPPKKPDGGSPAPAPGVSCTALSSCCSKLTNSLEQIGCFLAAGKKNELICTGAMLTFSCSSAGSASNASHGPSCAGLTSGALYCGNDGPHGDPSTLYECNGSNVSIVRQCPNGCQINDGVDDACKTSSGGGGGGTSSADCTGYSGRFCGTDGVGGSANTLYQCGNDTVQSSQACANGCVINSDPSLDDYCATSSSGGSGSSSSGGGSSSGVSCTGLPDYDYCGSDGVNGDADTLYTCAGGVLTNSQVCANGCTIGAANASDYCSYGGGSSSGGSSGGGGGGPDCSGLSDGNYCGNNGVMGDADTLYTCSGGVVSDSIYCDFGCYGGFFGGSDSCN